MPSNPENQARLERALHQALRELPPRRAPRSLEARVLAEVERRAALPWRKKGFVHWPLAARMSFLAFSGAVALLALWAGAWVMVGFDTAQVREAFAPQFAWLSALVTLADAVGSSLAMVARSLPPLWLYGGLGVLAALYIALFGLGAAAYRTLYADR